MAEEETPSSMLTGSIFERVKGFFQSMWEVVLGMDWTTFEPMGMGLGSAMGEAIDGRISDALTVALLKQVDRLGIPADIKSTLAEVVKDGDTGSLLLGYLVMIFYFTSYVGGHSEISGELSAHNWRNQYRPTLPDIASLILTMYRDTSKTPLVKDMLHKHGFTDERIDVLFAASKSIPAPDELRQLFLRNEITEEALNAGMKKYGFTDTEIGLLKKLFYPIPSYPDLIRMAVREAFYPDYVEEYGLMAELPAEYLEWTQKQGLSEDWAKKYWASHWELPSILRGYEMLHRSVINDEQLDSLFMAQDIMPWWRDKLKAISYHPLTRVDVRRVYRMGIIDRDQVYRTYLDLGYNEEKAEWLTKFTEMEQGEKERDLTKAEVLSAYTKNIISQPETNEMLLDLGYDQNEVSVLISMKDYQELKDNKARELKRIQKFFHSGAYSANQAIGEMGKLDMTGAEQNTTMALWESEKLARLDSPSKKDLDSLFKNNIINEAQYREEMAHLGFVPKYVEWFVLLTQAGGEES